MTAERRRLTEAEARAVLREYPDADLSAFEVDGDVEAMAVEETGKTLQTLASKRAHVQRAKQTRSHTCHWPGCGKQVPPAMWGCKAHWFRLPKSLRDEIWAAYVPGQESRMDPSEKYLDVAGRVDAWIREHGGPA